MGASTDLQTGRHQRRRPSFTHLAAITAILAIGLISLTVTFALGADNPPVAQNTTLPSTSTTTELPATPAASIDTLAAPDKTPPSETPTDTAVVQSPTPNCRPCDPPTGVPAPGTPAISVRWYDHNGSPGSVVIYATVAPGTAPTILHGRCTPGYAGLAPTIELVTFSPSETHLAFNYPQPFPVTVQCQMRAGYGPADGFASSKVWSDWTPMMPVEDWVDTDSLTTTTLIRATGRG